MKAAKKDVKEDNRFVSTLRALSLRHLPHLKAFPHHSRDFHTSPALPKDPLSKRKIIRVSKLNFGPFDTDLPPPSSTSAATIRTAPVPTEASRPLGMCGTATSLGFRDLSDTAVLGDPAATVTGHTAAWWKTEQRAADTSITTQRTCYSQGSWMEAIHGTVAGGNAIHTSNSSTTLRSFESELLRSEDWSEASEVSRSMSSVSGPWNEVDLTTSSINEESFIRIAETELGW